MASSTSLFLVVVLCLMAGLASAQSAVNTSGPSVLFHDPNSAVTYREYASCAINVHQIGQYSSTPTMMQFGGATTAGTIISSYDLSLIGGWDYGFTAGAVSTFAANITGYTGTGCNPLGRVAGGGAWLYNGNLVIMGGKSCPSWAWVNDVMYSTNQAASFSLSINPAPWTARSDFSLAVAPYTNVMVLAGGTNYLGDYTNDVWMSSDGIGAVWTPMTPAGPFQQYQQGPMSFLYDAASNPTGYATLVLYQPTFNQAWYSTSYGASWTMGFNFASAGINPNQDARMIAGATNNLYLAGGYALGSNQVLYSSNKGLNWTYLNNQNWNPNISNSVALDDFTYGCLAIRYTPSPSALSGYHRQLVLFGGNITLDNLVFSGYNCLFDTGTNSPAGTPSTSLLAEVIEPGEYYYLASSVPPSGYSPQMIYHDAGQWLTYRLYADCAYDVHQAVRKTQGLAMWQLGGFTSSYSYINTIDFTTTGSWLGLQEMNNPTYANVPSTGTPSGRVAAGAALLVNGNFLYFGGKDNATGVYVNDVYVSTNNGSAFTYVGQAAWQARSDFAAAVLPMTNIVVVIGGMYSSTGASTGALMNDVWISSDGQGATWTPVTATSPFPGFQDAAFTALYDSSVCNSSYTQTYSTLILYTGGFEDIFTSTNLAQTWTTAAAPWTYRTHGMFVADADNYVYFTGGSDTGDLWFSWNKGVSWVNVNTAGNAFGFNNNNGASLRPSSVYMNLYQYIQISGLTGNCMAMRYTANPASPKGYHKTLVIYGGANTIGVANRPASSCVQQLADNVLYAEVMFPSELRNASWTDTAMPVVPTGVVPAVTFNSPTVLLTYRQYPSCAYNVHSLTSHPSSPAQYVLGGWDENSNVLSTYDYIQGNSYSSYSYVASWGRYNTPPAGRTAAGAAVLYNGNLLWFGGKTNSASASNNYGNDVWYESTPTNGNGVWTLATLTAPWYARSDMSVAAMPGTNCVVLTGGQQISGGNFNDVWSSCDGLGAVWTVQSNAAPWWPVQQGAFVALFDGVAVGGSQANSTLVYYPAYNQQIFSSTNGGATWTVLGVAPWTYRTTAKFVADAESNLYMVGGENYGSIAGDDTTALGTQSLNDVWYSSNKGVSWYQMATTTNSAYSNAVQPSSFIYACTFINYSPGSGPQGYHRQLTVFSGFEQVYSSALQLGGQTTYSTSTFSFSQCICDEISGVRAISADLIFPGESVSASSSSSSSTSYSPGATAGIAVGVAVAACVLTSILCCLFLGGFTRGGAKATTTKGSNGNTDGGHRFEDEPSSSSPRADVEMHTNPSTSEGAA